MTAWLHTKKGAEWGTIIKYIIIVVGIIVGLIILGMIAIWLGIVSLDSMCEFGSTVRDKLSFVEPAGVAIPFWPQMCERQAVDITPDNWDVCPACKIRAGNTTNKTEVYSEIRNVALYQLAELLRRCWKTRGGGDLDPGSTDCFQFSLVDYPDEVDTEITTKDLLIFLKENNISNTETSYLDEVTTNIEIEGKIKKQEVWIIRYNDEPWKPGPGWLEDVTGISWFEWDPGDYLTIRRAPEVVVITPTDNCIRWPPCDKVCKHVAGYSNNTDTCFFDPACTPATMCYLEGEDEETNEV